MLGGIGLTKLNDSELADLLRALHEGRLLFPIRKSDLIAMGWANIADKADVLAGLDERGLRAVLVCVMAERRSKTRP